MFGKHQGSTDHPTILDPEYEGMISDSVIQIHCWKFSETLVEKYQATTCMVTLFMKIKKTMNFPKHSNEKYLLKLSDKFQQCSRW